MTEGAIKRVNFLRQGRQIFTYRTMVKLLSGWCAMLVLLYGVQGIRQTLVKREIRRANDQIQLLTKEKDEQLKLVQKASQRMIGINVQEGLTVILQRRPIWSGVLDRLTSALPAQVWLDSVAVVKDEEGEPRLSVLGRSRSQRALTDFIMNLETSGAFHGTALVSTRQEAEQKNVLSYDIRTEPLGGGS